MWSPKVFNTVWSPTTTRHWSTCWYWLDLVHQQWGPLPHCFRRLKLSTPTNGDFNYRYLPPGAVSPHLYMSMSHLVSSTPTYTSWPWTWCPFHACTSSKAHFNTLTPRATSRTVPWQCPCSHNRRSKPIIWWPPVTQATTATWPLPPSSEAPCPLRRWMSRCWPSRTS